MEAIKRDRCGQYYDMGCGGSKVTTTILKRVPIKRSGEVDLCRQCAGSLQKVLADWWEEK
jgi:trans-aconitate methyltransferase